MSLKFIALDSAQVRRLRNAAADANGQPPELSISDGDGNPCRHCLAEIERDKPMLILAHRPFDSLQPYAETGPIFLCAEDCARYPQSDGVPALYRNREMLIRGYDHRERIIYGSGKVIDMRSIHAEAERLFADPELAFIHVRSSSNNCYHFRIERQPL
jgi:hypothetical protein